MSSSFGPSRFGGGMKAADRPSRNIGKATSADLSAKRPKPKLKKVMPEVWKLVKPRRWLLLGSFFLIIINRLCSFALPVSSRYLINNVMNRHEFHLLPYIIGAVAAATFVQGITSYTLTQLLSTAGQRLISELRTQVQSHMLLLVALGALSFALIVRFLWPQPKGALSLSPYPLSPIPSFTFRLFTSALFML